MQEKNIDIAIDSTLEDKKKIQKMKFCIISNFKSQFVRNNLLMFALDNK